MTYELAKELKDAGFPQNPNNPQVHTAICGNFDNPDPECRSENRGRRPTLEELIEACGEGFNALIYKGVDIWLADGGERIGGIYGNEHLLQAKTPTEAVARLWLALNKK